MSLEEQQYLLLFNECSLEVIPLLHIIIDIWRDICSMDESNRIITHVANILKALRQEVFLVLQQIFRLYEEENIKSPNPVIESSIELYWQFLECQLSIWENGDNANVKEDKLWSVHWLHLINNIVFNAHKNSSIRELVQQVLRKIKKKTSFRKLHSHCLLNCKLMMDMCRWFPQQDLKRTVKEWLDVSKTLIELFDTFEAFSIFGEIEQKRYSYMLSLQQKDFQKFLSCFENDMTTVENDYWIYDFMLHRWTFSYVSFHFQNAVFLQKVLQSFGNILKRSYYKVTVNEVVKTELYDIFDVIKSTVMICLHEAIPDEAKLYDVLFPALEGIHLFISASSPSSSDLIKNVAKLFHNIAALLVQKRSSLLIASICMRRSIELREMIKGEKENQMSRFGLLCKIMLRLSEPCACASIILEMIYYADPSNSPSKMQIPSDILKALSCFVYWCENNESSLQEYFGISALEQLAIQGGPSAVEFAFLAFRLLQWKVNDHFTQLYHTWSCERNCVIVLQRHCNDPVTQYWLQLEILRFKFYEDLTLIDDPILPSKYDDRDESTSAQVECLQWIHLSWKLLVDLMMNNSNYSFQNSGILELWNNILQYSPQIIRPIILIHLFEILEWFCEIFLVTQNSQLLWTVAQMLCHFITVFRENCPIDMVRIREYLTFVSAVALKNYRLYENAQALLSYSCLDNSVESVELLLLRFALDICSYEKSNEFEIPNLTDLYPSKSSHALYKFYHSQYLWKKGNLKGSYDKALEAVKLYLALLQQSSLQSPANCTTIEENEELKTLNVADKQLNVSAGWEKYVTSLAVYQKQSIIGSVVWMSFKGFNAKSLQIDKFKRSIESFQFLIQEIQQNLQDSVLQALSCFYLKRLSLMNEMVHLHLSSSTACCLEQLEECNEIRKDHTFLNLTDSGNNYIASSNSYKLCSIITRRFVDPHDQAICFYKHAKRIFLQYHKAMVEFFD
ncbi:Separin [Galdieria sulphuraria]|nr:Separin [Galdieria sulphuraria]